MRRIEVGESMGDGNMSDDGGGRGDHTDREFFVCVVFCLCCVHLSPFTFRYLFCVVLIYLVLIFTLCVVFIYLHLPSDIYFVHIYFVPIYYGFLSKECMSIP